MDTEEYLEEALGRVEELLPMLNLEKEDEWEDEIDGEKIKGFNFSGPRNIFQVFGTYPDETEFLVFRYPYNIIQNLAFSLKRKDTGENEIEISEGSEYIEKSKDRIRSLTDREIIDIKSGLIERLVSETCHFTFEEEEDLPLTQFFVDSRVIVDEDFSATQLENIRETLSSRGVMGRIWLGHKLNQEDELLHKNTQDPYKSSDEQDLGYIG